MTIRPAPVESRAARAAKLKEYGKAAMSVSLLVFIALILITPKTGSGYAPSSNPFSAPDDLLGLISVLSILTWIDIMVGAAGLLAFLMGYLNEGRAED